MSEVTTAPGGWGPKIARGETHSRRGRPLKLTPKVAETITLALRTWHHFETACALAGVGKTAAYSWLRDGADLAERVEAGDIRMSSLGKEERRKLEFSTAVRRSIAQAEAQGVDWVARAAGLPTTEIRTKEKVVGTAEDGEPVIETETTVIERPPSWQPGAWLLEHRFADRWATRREVSGPSGGPVPVEATHELGADAKAALFGKIEAMAANLSELAPAPDVIDTVAVESEPESEPPE